MTESRFNERSSAVLEALLAGSSIADAARHAGVGVRTVGNWLEHGRREPDSKYGPFAQAVDASRSARELPSREQLDELTEEEVRRLLTRAARKGSVPAVKLWLDRFLPAGDEESAESEATAVLVRMDEVARRRSKHA